MPHSTNTLPLPPKRLAPRKYSLPGDKNTVKSENSDYITNECPVNSDNNSVLSIISELNSSVHVFNKASLVDLSATDSGIMCNSSIPKSPSLSTLSTLSKWIILDRSDSSEEDIKLSTETIADVSIAETYVNELPLPPRCPRKRPLRGTKPPPRHLLGPKPSKFVGDGSKDSEVVTDDKDSELDIREGTDSELYSNGRRKDSEIIIKVSPWDSQLSLDDKEKDSVLYMDDKDSELFADDKNSELFTDDKNSELFTDEKNFGLFMDDKDSELFAHYKDSDLFTDYKDSELLGDDKNSELFTDDKDKNSVLSTDDKDKDDSDELTTVTPMIEETDNISVDIDDMTETTDYTNLEEMKRNGMLSACTDSRCETTDLISQSSTDTTVVTSIEVMAKRKVNQRHTNVSRETSCTDSFRTNNSKIDYTKLSKDIQNKMSKDTQRSAKNLAAEITDFLKISASKLRPPCLFSKKQENVIEKVIINDIPEKNRRLIPRSPYIAPVRFDHIVHRTQPQPSTWKVNPKLPYTKSLSPLDSWCDAKRLKNLENAARKKLLLRDDDKSEPITRQEKAALAQKINYPLITRSEQQTHTLMARDLKLRSRLYLSMNDKIVTRLPTQSVADLKPKGKKRDRSQRKIADKSTPPRDYSKQPPKFIVPLLPLPRITLKAIRAQLPCNYPEANKSANKSLNSIYNIVSPADKVDFPTNFPLSDSQSTYLSLLRQHRKRYENEQQQKQQQHNVDEFANVVFRTKPDNTWPPKSCRGPKK